MKKKCLVSVIIPTYKRVKKLKKAIDSVLSQTFTNWEIIIIDNHSLDGTKELVDNYNNPKIKMLLIKNNGNIAKSRNLGIKKSKGKYVALLDSDDLWTPNKLQICINTLGKKTVLVYHDMYIQKNTKQIIFRKSGMCRNLKKPIYYDLILNGPAFPTSSVVVKKDIFKKISFFNEQKKLITWEDFDAWIRFSKINEGFKKINQVLGFRYTDDENTLKPNILIKTIFLFKKKYLKNGKLPNWCKVALAKSYYNNNQLKKSFNMLKKVDFKILLVSEKIKYILLFVILKFKKISIFN
jgi:glycosyltransferase involved in cell wall biosynthesis